MLLKVCVITTSDHIRKSWILREKMVLESIGCEVMVEGVRDENPSVLLLLDLRRIARVIRRCHLVIAWFAFPSTILLCKMMGIPVIANGVGYEITCYPGKVNGIPCNPVWRPLVSLALKQADEVIAISRESMRWIKKWSGREGSVVYECIDTEKYSCKNTAKGRSVENPVIVTISCLSTGNVVRKDLITLLKAIAIVKKRYPNIKLLMIGEKREAFPVLKELSRKLGIENNVVFTGFIGHDELLEKLCSSSIFVMTSYHEGFPTVACEAALTETPLIVSNRPAVNEVFNESIAYLVEPGNPNLLADTIVKALENYEESLEKARRAKIYVTSNFSIDSRKRKLRVVLIRLLRRISSSGNINRYYKSKIAYIIVLIMLIIYIRAIKKLYDVLKVLVRLSRKL